MRSSNESWIEIESDDPSAEQSTGKTDRHLTKGFCVISWLHDMSWHPMANSIESRILSDADLPEAFQSLEARDMETSKPHQIATLLDYMFGGGICKDGRRAAPGEILVAKLWEPAQQCQ